MNEWNEGKHGLMQVQNVDELKKMQRLFSKKKNWKERKKEEDAEVEVEFEERKQREWIGEWNS